MNWFCSSLKHACIFECRVKFITLVGDRYNSFWISLNNLLYLSKKLRQYNVSELGREWRFICAPYKK